MVLALNEYHIAPIHTNIQFLLSLAQNPFFVAGEVHTGFIQVPTSHSISFEIFLFTAPIDIPTFLIFIICLPFLPPPPFFLFP